MFPEMDLLFFLLLLPISAHYAASFESSAPANSSWIVGEVKMVLQTPVSNASCGFLPVKLDDELLFVFAVYITSADGGVTTDVWKANRNNPAPRNSTLQFGLDGNLVLRRPNGSLVWESGTGSRGVERMQLLTTQNLMLLNSNSTVVWQSFDHPTDSLVSGQVLPVGKSLVADTDDFSFREGYFRLTVEPHQVVFYYTRYEDPQPYAAWPSPNSDIAFLMHRGTSMVICDRAGRVISSTSLPDSNSVVKLHRSGMFLAIYNGLQVRHFWWDSVAIENCRVPSCGNYGLCTTRNCSCPGGQVNSTEYRFEAVDENDPGAGCKLVSTPITTNPATTTLSDFLKLDNVDHVSAKYLKGLSGVSAEECKQACVDAASCHGVTFRSAWSSQASLCHLSEVMLLVSSPEQNVTTFLKLVAVQKVPFLQPAAGGTVKGLSHNRKMTIAISVLASSSFLALVLFIAVYRRLRKTPKGNKHSEAVTDKEVILPNLAQRFSYSELLTMTCQFQNKIGEGGYSSVYQGVLPDGSTKVAVKCLEGGPKQSQKQFEAEVLTIGSTDHRNLVKLLGYGVENNQQYYLVYEFLLNFSLDRWLFDSQGVLSWSTRFSIALDIASGLSYLHHGCRSRVLHLDIKPQNVLLDAEFTGKICDFGLSKQMVPGRSGVQTLVRGTPGYMAPEWLQSKVSEKADVYSFGLVLLELVSGQKTVHVPAGVSLGPSLMGLNNFQEALNTEVMELVVDKRLGSNFEVRQLQKVVEVGMLCVQEDPSSRPTMAQVTQMLEDSTSSTRLRAA